MTEATKGFVLAGLIVLAIWLGAFATARTELSTPIDEQPSHPASSIYPQEEQDG